MHLRGTLWGLAMLGIAGLAQEESAIDSVRFSAADQAAHNRAVGLMGRFDYQGAMEIFSELDERLPGRPELKVNRAIATYNRQQQGDETLALILLDEALKLEPGNLRAQYNAGILHLYLGHSEKAESLLRAVIEADPSDAYATYFHGQALLQKQEVEQALAQYERAAQLDPYLRSAYYGIFMACQRLGKREQGMDPMATFRKMAKNPRAKLAEFKYTRMGEKARVLVIDPPDKPKPKRLKGPTFAELEMAHAWEATPETAVPMKQANVTACDTDRDGALELHIIRRSGDRTDLSRWKVEGEGQLTQLEPSWDLPAGTQVHTVLWGDLNNDGNTDAYLCCQGPNILMLHSEPGTWQDVTETAGVGLGAADTVDGLLLDADHDGDLDIFCVNQDGPNELFNNDLNGRFRPIGEAQGVTGGNRATRQVVAADLDRDRDLDLLVLHEAPPHEILINDRLWQYHASDMLPGFRTKAWVSVLVADMDADGWPEIMTQGNDGAWFTASVAPGEGGMSPLTAPDAIKGRPGPMAAADVDGDGSLEWLVTVSDGWAAMALNHGSLQLIYHGQHAHLACWRAITHDHRGPFVWGINEKGDVLCWASGPGRHDFAAMTFSGLIAPGESMRSNASGYGVRLEARQKDFWTVMEYGRMDSGPGQSLMPLTVGSRGLGDLDFVAMEWSDGVFQTELNVKAGTTTAIKETQRQLSSCPILFAWNGEEYDFITDILGVGGLGYAVGPGEYAPSRPWETLVLADHQLQPRNGILELKICQPMEEVIYLDSVSLTAYQIPKNWEMITDDRMAVLGPEPTGAPVFYRRELIPIQAFNERGEDVLEEITHRDLTAPDPGPIDPRFIGRLNQEHALTLRFDEPIQSSDIPPVLVMDGWIEYPYSQTMFAAWQAGATYDAPSLDILRHGEWVTPYEQFGYPAGMPRTASFPLADLPAASTTLRLRTNQEIYWDRLAIAMPEPCPEATHETLTLISATLRANGFPLRINGPQRQPDFLDLKRTPYWDTRYMDGFYTALGPVTELVAETDDVIAITGPGEEVSFRFKAPGTPLKPGFTRVYLIHATGWCKDMDLYTQHGDTVGPLPHRRPVNEKKEALHTRYHTRYQAGY